MSKIRWIVLQTWRKSQERTTFIIKARPGFDVTEIALKYIPQLKSCFLHYQKKFFSQINGEMAAPLLPSLSTKLGDFKILINVLGVVDKSTYLIGDAGEQFLAENYLRDNWTLMGLCLLKVRQML